MGSGGRLETEGLRGGLGAGFAAAYFVPPARPFKSYNADWSNLVRQELEWVDWRGKR